MTKLKQKISGCLRTQGPGKVVHAV
jgi:hypothetical protein